MRHLLSILTIFLFTGATKHPEETRSPWHRSFYAEMKKLEKPGRVTAFSAVQTATNTKYGGTSLNITISSSGSNNLLIVSIFVVSTNTVTSVTDNQSNTYVLSSALTVSGYYNHYTAYGFQITGGVTTVTVNVNSTTDYIVIVDEFSGFTGSPTNGECFDDQSSNAVYSQYPSAGTITQTQAGCLIHASSMNDNDYTISAGSGYTIYGNSDYYGGSYLRTEYKLSGSTSENPDFSLPGLSWTGNWGTSFRQEDWVPASNTGKAIRSAGN